MEKLHFWIIDQKWVESRLGSSDRSQAAILVYRYAPVSTEFRSEPTHPCGYLKRWILGDIFLKVEEN